MSGGASRPISRALITAELLLLPFARWCDRSAAPYHHAGIPLLEDMFVPMSGVAPFHPRHPIPRDASARPAPRPAAIRRRVSSAYRRRSFLAAADAIEAELAALAATPEENVLLRHLLESARRVAELAPVHAALAVERGLRSPEWLSSILLRVHLWGLGLAAALDRRARPLQARGIAILAQDLPPIPSTRRP